MFDKSTNIMLGNISSHRFSRSGSYLQILLKNDPAGGKTIVFVRDCFPSKKGVFIPKKSYLRCFMSIPQVKYSSLVVFKFSGALFINTSRVSTQFSSLVIISNREIYFFPKSLKSSLQFGISQENGLVLISIAPRIFGLN